MKAILVRVGIDGSCGEWNAPVDPATGDYVYVPIPEAVGAPVRPGLERRFEEAMPALQDFAARHSVGANGDPHLPRRLLGLSMHLDPDFEHLTYGDDGARRGSRMRRLAGGDLLVFYAGLRSIRSAQRLIYALVGLFTVTRVVSVSEVPRERWHENAHTRRARTGSDDIVVRGDPRRSGRLARCIPIGEFRDRAYRVRPQVMHAWGGLSVRDGYIQRSARPPLLLDACRFHDWFRAQDVVLVRNNFGP